MSKGKLKEVIDDLLSLEYINYTPIENALNEAKKEFPTSQTIKDKYHEGRNEINPTIDTVFFHNELNDWFKKYFGDKNE